MTESWPAGGYDAANTGHGTGVTPPDGPVEERWHHDLGGKLAYAPPVVDPPGWPGQVYVHGLMTQVRTPNVRAVDRDDGELRWAVDTGLEYGFRSGSPTLAEERAFLPGGWVVEKDSGGRNWSVAPHDWRDRPAAIVDGLLHFGFTALDFETGDRRWRADVDGMLGAEMGDPGNEDLLLTGSAPAVAEGTVFVVGETYELPGRPGDEPERTGHVHAFDAETGSVRWAHDFDTPVPDDPLPTVVADGMVYVLDGDGALRTFDAGDGRERWRVDIHPGEAGTGIGRYLRPTVGEGRVLVPGPGGQLEALVAPDGTVAWRLDLGRSLGGPPALVDGVAYAATTDGDIIAVDADAGTVRWRVEVDDQLGGGPVVADGRLYVGGYALHCLEPRA